MENELLEKQKYMQKAIELALLGQGRTNPNPLVGAVIVKDGKILGQGYHHIYGDLHAERDALKNCYENNNNPSGAEIYVTLEPCCHFGKQPPCTQAIVEAGIKRVYVGSADPNPLVAGKGVKFLRNNNIEVIENFLKEECDKINPIFFHYISTKTPYVALKYAMTLDGKIATVTGKSKWISCEESRNYVHVLRNKYFAILVGINTVLKDDPMLNCRIQGKEKENLRNPVRIICDTKLSIPENSKIVNSAKEIPTIIATSSKTVEIQKQKAEFLKNKGIELVTSSSEDKINLKELMIELGQRKIDSVLIEGGGEINFSALEQGIVNHVYCFTAPKIFGGTTELAKSPVAGKGIADVEKAIELENLNYTTMGTDILIEGDIKKCSQE